MRLYNQALSPVPRWASTSFQDPAGFLAYLLKMLFPAPQPGRAVQSMNAAAGTMTVAGEICYPGESTKGIKLCRADVFDEDQLSRISLHAPSAIILDPGFHLSGDEIKDLYKHFDTGMHAYDPKEEEPADFNHPFWFYFPPLSNSLPGASRLVEQAADEVITFFHSNEHYAEVPPLAPECEKV